MDELPALLAALNEIGYPKVWVDGVTPVGVLLGNSILTVISVGIAFPAQLLLTLAALIALRTRPVSVGDQDG